MNPKALPADGPEREIMLRALREYRETCEQPQLHPSCPYSIDVRPGLRNCGEECMDLLAEYDAPPPEDHELFLGEFGLRRVRRARPRRGPEPGARAYDARESRLKETSENCVEWSTTSLLYELRDRFQEPPGDDGRATLILACMAELDRRGFDSELVIRHVFTETVAATVGLAHVIAKIVQSQAPIDAIPSGWARLLGADPEEPPTVSMGRVRRIQAWLRTLSIPDLIEWSAPTEAEFAELDGSTEESEDASRHLWIGVRFLSSYISDWPTDVLKLEWRYMRGEIQAPCPADEMLERRVGEDQLAKELALRLMSDRAPKGSFPTNSYVSLAVELVEEGRHEAAAEIFRVGTDVAPTDALAWNNYGFCLLPTDPAAALRALQTAADLGLASWTVNVADRILALFLGGRLSSALQLAEEHLTVESTAPEAGYLWRLDVPMDAPKIYYVSDATPYILELAVRIAEQSGDASLLQVWRGRQASYPTT